MNTIRTALALTSAAVLLPALAHAQTPDPVGQSDMIRRQQELDQLLKQATATGGDAPALYPDETKDVGPQSILKVKRRKTYVETYLDSQFFHTSNMFLQEDTKISKPTATTLFVNTVQAAFAPVPYQVGPGLLSPRIGARYQWYLYGLGDDPKTYDPFNFDAQTIFADLRYRYHGNWIFEAGVDVDRLVGHLPTYGSFNEIYKEVAPRWSVTRMFPITETRVVSVAYLGNYHISETPTNPNKEINDRTDQSLLVLYSHAFNEHFVVQPFYRLQYTRYTSDAANGRNDLLHTFGLSAYYFFTPQISVRAFATWDIRDSDAAFVADYQKIDAGIGFNLNFRF